MDTKRSQLERLRAANAWVRLGDKNLRAETFEAEETPTLESALDVDAAIELESIVMRRERPVLAIRENSAHLVFVDAADSAIWEARLKDARSGLDKAIRAVGRIELEGGPLAWAGTGWLVHDNIVVTNRHVAEIFAERAAGGFNFSRGSQGQIRASVDYLQEFDNPNTLVFRLIRPLHIEPAPGPDVAFFETDVVSGQERLASQVALSKRPRATPNVATIGYPAQDGRIPDQALMERIYGGRYDKKRLAPGAITSLSGTRILHNCTTLGGNSGSIVVDLDSGEALGLHFSGTFLSTNYAVRSDVVQQLLDRVRSRRAPVGRGLGGAREAQAVGATVNALAGGAGQITIPLIISVSVGDSTKPAITVFPDTGSVVGSDGESLLEVTESVESYADREGYVPTFLGDGVEVALPVVLRYSDDVQPVEGSDSGELRYHHFSVVMSRSRRLCFLSAVNIDGAESKKTRRPGWRLDPRIPERQQVIKECYGNPPKFSRGHMTRREDPAWGSQSLAQRANADSMHVTNATPQMQAFNAPIWLELEDYALQNAKGDGMRISVFTGPYFRDDDPSYYGVAVPASFWKVIAFIHDGTGELCATGYEMDQQDSLPGGEEFVFGPFNSSHVNQTIQVPIRTIEEKTGISFGILVDVDPLDAEDETIEAIRAPLQRLEQIRFV